VIRVVVGEEDLAQFDEPYRGAKQLSLGALPAIDEDPLSSPA
jgi:hypothetical protein